MTLALEQKAGIYHRLSAMVKSGIPLDQALSPEFMPGGGRKRTVEPVEDIRAGRPLSLALSRAGLIPAWERKLLELGEKSGSLEPVLENLDDFFSLKSSQFRQLKSKLVYPFILTVAAIMIPPLPALAGGSLSLPAYTAKTLAGLSLLFAAYTLLIKRPFEKSAIGGFNPLLTKCQRLVGNNHLFRLAYEVSWLDMLSLCLRSGLDPARSLRLLRDNHGNRGRSHQHTLAIQDIEKHGRSLVQAVTGNAILKNEQITGFLNASEQSGTLHSDLREFVIRKRSEVSTAINHLIGRISNVAFILLTAYLIASIFSQGNSVFISFTAL